MRSASSRSMTARSSPSSSPTRSRSAPAKSSSPRIARSVMAATRSPMPATLASSSMHSCPISVESMSATSSFLSRPASGCTNRSSPAGGFGEIRAPRRPRTRDRRPRRRASQRVSTGAGRACATRRTAASVRPPGAATSVATETGMGSSREYAESAPHRRADRQRQVRAGAAHRARDRRGDRQRRFHAALPRSARAHRAAERGRGTARAAPPVRRDRRRRQFLGRPLRGAGARNSCRPSRPADLRRRHRALLPRADRRALRHSRRARGDARAGARARPKGGRRRTCTPSLPASIPPPPRGCAPATASACCARSKCSPPPAARSPPSRTGAANRR